jgi:rhamnogalacturonan endolyase
MLDLQICKRRGRITLSFILGLFISLLTSGLFLQTGRIQAAGSVSLQVSGMNATISNGIFTIKFKSSGNGYSLVYKGRELIGPAKGFYGSIDGGSSYRVFRATQLKVVINTSSMVDIAYISSWGAFHYVVLNGVSGLYSYFIAGGIGTVGEFRTVYEVDSNIFNTGYNGEKSAIALPSASQLQAATTVQDATYKLANGTIYTKYDAAAYVNQYTLHGIYGSGYGVWMISPSHEYVNGGPMKQDLTVHAVGVVLNMLVSGHFGTPGVSIPSGKIYGPWFLYFNNGSLSDARAQAAAQVAQWPYRWLSDPSYPLSRTTVTGALVLSSRQPAARATVILAAPSGDVYTQGTGYIFSTQANAKGHFTLPKVRPGTYSLYVWANGGPTTPGSIGTVADQYEQDHITVSGPSVNLGTLTWKITQYKHFLWQIGTADRKADEFKLGNVPRQYGLWNQVPADLTYTIGKSTPANDWYYAQTKVGTWNVIFKLRQTGEGKAHLTVALAGASNYRNHVSVLVNHTSVATYPQFPNDQTIYRSGNQSGFYHLLTFTFPASLLKVGSNTIAFKMTNVNNGGGIMYDFIKLETD